MLHASANHPLKEASTFTTNPKLIDLAATLAILISAAGAQAASSQTQLPASYRVTSSLQHLAAAHHTNRPTGKRRCYGRNCS